MSLLWHIFQLPDHLSILTFYQHCQIQFGQFLRIYFPPYTFPNLNLFFQGVGKRDFRPNNYLFLNQYSSEWNVPQKINIDYWTPDNPDALFPRPRIGNSNEVFQAQTRFLQNAAYVRLKQLTIGYTLPKEMIQKAGIDNVRIYFSGNNVWEYSPILKIFDPEITSVQTYPLVRSFSIGLDIVL